MPKATDCTVSNGSKHWYDGIPTIRVYWPGEDVAADAAALYKGDMEKQQFTDRRYALLLAEGTYTGDIPVGYYTQLMGVGANPQAVTVGSFSTLDNPDVGNACDNFWRSVEGLTTSTHGRVYWAASQAAPVRRVVVQGELWLSEQGSPHWSSGGFLADSIINGVLQMGTQQQYLVRNSYLNGGVGGHNKNYVFVGDIGAPGSTPDGTISNVATAPKARSKPHLREQGGVWTLLVPTVQLNVAGLPPSTVETISFDDVFVAREGDTASSINTGIVGKRALLLTPGIYGLEEPIQIDTPGFVVLGIGFPTLVALNGRSAMEIYGEKVIVASVLFEAGTPRASSATAPLLNWIGNLGYGFDIFTRVGAFSYSRGFKPSCLQTRADVHVQVGGSQVTLDNIWLWHADHDDCGGQSDSSFSASALVVTGDDVIVYGLKAEHTFQMIVRWTGERGKVYLFQSELPYHAASYPDSGAYFVDQSVGEHTAVGVGVYMVGTPYVVDTAFRVPPSADMMNMFTWAINGKNTQFRSVVCTSAAGLDHCYYGDHCDEKSCYVYKLRQEEEVTIV